MKEIKGLNKRRDIPCPWVERQHSKDANSPQIDLLKFKQLNYSLNAIPIKIPGGIFADLEITLK